MNIFHEAEDIFHEAEDIDVALKKNNNSNKYLYITRSATLAETFWHDESENILKVHDGQKLFINFASYYVVVVSRVDT